jgi:hypothetical protein
MHIEDAISIYVSYVSVYVYYIRYHLSLSLSLYIYIYRPTFIHSELQEQL